MDIYVQSRGLDRDYYWTAKKENQPEEEIPTSPPIIKKATALIDDEVFSVVILRSQDNNLLLLVAGLQTTRQDIKTRMIRNSVALIGTNEEEPILRKVAALALQNELESKINQAVDNSPEGFKVNWEKIKDIISVSTDRVEDLPSREDRGKIALLSEGMKQSLATELLKFSLPQKAEALVIVTKSKSKETLVGANVWRGLSNDPSISANWMLTPGDKHTNPSAPFPKRIVLFLFGIIVATVLIITLISKLSSNYHQPCGGNQEVLTRIISNLKPAEQSEEVKTLQRILTTENIRVKIDGIFDADTKNAVQQFQKQYNQGKDKAQQIQVDGIVNDATLKALWQETKNNKTQNNITLEEELWNNGLCKP